MHRGVWAVGILNLRVKPDRFLNVVIGPRIAVPINDGHFPTLILSVRLHLMRLKGHDLPTLTGHPQD